MTTMIIKFKMIALMVLVNISILFAQTQETFEKNVALKNGQAVNLELKFAKKINIKTWNKQQVYIKVAVEHNLQEKLVYKLVEHKGLNELRIEEKVKNLENNNSIIINGNNSNKTSRNCINMSIDYEVYMPANVQLSVKTISGDIEEKGMSSSLSLKTISGFVDVSIDSSKSYDVNCSTISGSIYSDLKFDSKGDYKQHIVGSKLNTSLNGGGKLLKLKTISGDIYLRKR